MQKSLWSLDNKALFTEFVAQEQLDSIQAEKFKTYLEELIDWNKKMNLTTLETVKGIINYHFRDSLILKKYINLNTFFTLADIGTGAGFPGIPLKIQYPHITMILIEVNNKKIEFLHHLIAMLKLTNIEICPLDWRTFIRKTAYQIDLFCTRAALDPLELIRIFRANSSYRNAQLVYWASAQWQANKKVEPFIVQECPYSIANRKYKLVFFKQKNKKEQK